MSVRRDRGKAAFPPTDRNLGGASQIIDEYRHFQKRINAVQPSTVEIARAKVQASDVSMSERLRVNRAARRAAVDLTAVNHINNVYHMHRRIEDQYSATERLKDPWDTTVHPSFLRRPTNMYTDMIQSEMAAWQRPKSAPARRRGDGYAGWTVKESALDAFPTSRYAEARRLADHTVYKKAIMAEIVDNRLYKEPDLRKLFRAYVRLAPMGDKDTVEAVVEEIKKELDVR